MQVCKRLLSKKEILKKEKYIILMFKFFLSIAGGYRAPILHFFISWFWYMSCIHQREKIRILIVWHCGAIIFSNSTLYAVICIWPSYIILIYDNYSHCYPSTSIGSERWRETRGELWSTVASYSRRWKTQVHEDAELWPILQQGLRE
jgi:hypothetical protein